MERNQQRPEDRTQVRILRPGEVKIFRGTFNMLHVMVPGEDLYRGVFAVRAFPVKEGMRYISLFYHDDEDRIREIGMIEDLSCFGVEEQKLVLDTLAKHYFAFEIVRILSIRREYGFLFFDVETEQGPRSFTMRWDHTRAVDFGERGKVLLDVFEDRYIVRNVSELPPRDRELFTRFIFW